MIDELSISEVRSRLPKLVARVARGCGQVVITRHGKPVADLVAHRDRKSGGSPYSLRGLRIRVAPDFDEPMPGLWGAMES